jgi:hypothetical protein
MQLCDLSQRWLSIDQWRHAVASDCETESAEQSSSRSRPQKRRRADTDKAPPPAMSTPPPSDRAQSPSKRMKLSHRSRAHDDDDDEDDPFISADTPLDPDQTPRRTTTAGGIIGTAPQLTPRAPSSVASLAFSTQTPSVASGTTTSSTKSRARSTSPTKKTQGLLALKKPIFHVALKDDTLKQLPRDVHELYNRLYDITVEHDGVVPWEVRTEINSQVARPLRDSWFRKRRDDTTPSLGKGLAVGERQQRARALAELDSLRKIERKAWECRTLGMSEPAWNMEVHGPLLELALESHGHVRRLLVTTAQIAKPFVPPMGGTAAAEYADKKMVDFAMVLVPDPGDDDDGAGEARGTVLGDTTAEDVAARIADAAEDPYRRLASVIRNTVDSQPPERRTINQSMYTPLWYRPIGVSIETKADGANDAGRLQLAVWTAAWHERMKDMMDTAGKWTTDTRLITMPLLLIVEDKWALSFACDRGDRLEIVGEMHLGDTANLRGLYTLVAVVRELADWVQGPFCEWIAGVLEA